MQVENTPVNRISLPDLYNLEIAFKAYSKKELKRVRFLYGIIKFPVVVWILSGIIKFAVQLKLPLRLFLKKNVFEHFCGGEYLVESLNVVNNLGRHKISSILDYSVEGKEVEKHFRIVEEEVIKIIELASKNPNIPYTSIKLSGIISSSILGKISNNHSLSIVETEDFKRGKERLDRICFTAHKYNVPIYIDAEESWIQDVIDDLVFDLMLRYNKEKTIVSTTIQMYRRDKYNFLKDLLKKSREEGIFLGIKLVRGAYWVQELEYAKREKIETKVFSEKESTDMAFNYAQQFCLKNLDVITLCSGTHNENSVLELVKIMIAMGLNKNHPKIWFSQLYGMSNHISYNLVEEGYNVSKYLPYGPIQCVIPYLLRRAEENTSVKGQMGRELKLVIAEKNRRKLVR